MKSFVGWSAVRYGKWDGTQGFELEESEVFAQIADTLLYHGDPMSALRDLMARGIQRGDGNDIIGLREILSKLREKREAIFNEYDPSGLANEIDSKLREIVDRERASLDDLLNVASQSNDRERIRSAEEKYLNHQVDLDTLPASLASRLDALRSYNFNSASAKEDFEKLIAELAEQISSQYFQKTKDALQELSAQDLRNYRTMLADLASLLEAHSSGANTSESFAEFMSRYGEMFPADIDSVDALIDHLIAGMSANGLAFGALGDEQRQELFNLMESVFSDLDLSGPFSQLMTQLSPYLDTSSLDKMRFSGDKTMNPFQASQILSDLDNIDAIETFMRSVAAPDDLSRLDIDVVRSLLGDKTAASVAQLAALARKLKDAGLISISNERLSLTSLGLRRIGDKMLDEVFEQLDKSKFGAHSLKRRGVGLDRDFETKVYEYGDPLELSVGQTLRNTIVRQGGGLPLRVAVEDFAVETSEMMVTASTVLCLDLSLSMPLRDNFLAAKKVAIALHSLISARYPKDYLGIVGFSEVAHVIKPSELPMVSWDYVYGTNMEDALRHARKLLRGREGKKQILMVTDGEPTAHITQSGEPFFSYPSAPETIRATLNEVVRCTKAQITINSFVLDANEYLRDFMNSVAKLNNGRVFYTDPSQLGKYIMVDFLEGHAR